MQKTSLRGTLAWIFSSAGFIVVAAFLIRMAFLYHYYRAYGETTASDVLPLGLYGEVGSIARAIVAGRGFSSPLVHHNSGPTAWLPPIFPYLLALVFKLFGTYSYTSGLVIHTLDLAFSAFTCWPVYVIGEKIFGKATGAASAWLWAVSPNAIFFPLVWVWDTGLAGLWLALLFAVTLRLRGSDKIAAWAGYGALWAIGAMINSSLLAVLPFWALWAIWPLRPQLARCARLAVVSALIFAAGLTPWTIRNYVVFRKFIPLRSNFALELWLGNNPQAMGTWSGGLHPNENDAEAARYVSMTEIPYMAEKQHEALAFMQSHPLETGYAIYRRFMETWLGIWDSPLDVWPNASLTERLTILWDILFALFSFLGVLFTYRQRKPEAIPLAAAMLAFPMIFYVTHPSLRYRYPLDTIMVVLSVFAVGCCFSKLAQTFAGAQRLPGARVHARGGD